MTWNQQQSRSARERIREAIADLLNQNTLPPTATARFEILTGQYRIRGQTLYKHRNLWHPACLWITPPDPLDNKMVLPPVSAEGAPDGRKPKSFLYNVGCNSLPDNDSGSVQPEFLSPIDSNTPVYQEPEPPPLPAPDAPPGPRYIQQVLFEIQHRRKQERTAPKQRQLATKTPEAIARVQAHEQRMRQYLDSGDPILMAEAMQWFEGNPGFLKQQE